MEEYIVSMGPEQRDRSSTPLPLCDLSLHSSLSFPPAAFFPPHGALETWRRI